MANVFLYFCISVPLRALVGRVGKGTVPLHLEHVYSRLRSCAASWSAWIRGMYQIIEALWTVHELSADIAVAAMQVPGGEGGDPSSSDAPSDSEASELSEASPSEESEGDLPPPGDPPDQPVAGGRGAEPPLAHEAVVLMGLGDQKKQKLSHSAPKSFVFLIVIITLFLCYSCFSGAQTPSGSVFGFFSPRPSNSEFCLFSILRPPVQSQQTSGTPAWTETSRSHHGTPAASRMPRLQRSSASSLSTDVR